MTLRFSCKHLSFILLCVLILFINPQTTFGNIKNINISNYALRLPGGDGNNSNINISGIPLTTLPYTIEMWIYPDSVQQDNAGLIFNRPSNVGFQYNSSWQQPWEGIRYMANGGDTYGTLTETPDVTIGVWHHIAVVITSTSRTVYFDGVTRGADGTENYSESASFSATDWSSTSTYLGWDSDGSIKAFEGLIDEVRIWNTARTQSEIINNRYSVLTGSETGLVAYYNFDDQAATATDLTSNGNDGIITGGTYVQSTITNSSNYVISNAKLSYDTISTSAFTTASGSNFVSFQQNAITTYNGYQYTIYWNSSSQVCLARKKMPSGDWQELTFNDYTSPHDLSDNHYTISFGICENDGTIHIAYDHHNDELNYRRSNVDLVNDPENAVWSTSSFTNDINYLESGVVLDGTAFYGAITYPRFITKPNGDLLFECRTGISGDGNSHLWEYSNGTWSYIGEYLHGRADGMPNGYVDNCGYINGLYYTPGGTRLHVSLVWRDSPDANTNHEVCYAYSDDDGRTWYNTDGVLIGTTGSSTSSELLNYYSTGFQIKSIDTNRGLINQESMAIDSNGKPHILQSFMPYGVTAGSWLDRRNKSYMHHIYQNGNGDWQCDPIAPSYVDRAEIAIDASNNLYVVGPKYRVYYASAENNWQNWTQLDVSEFGTVTAEPVVDRQALLNENVLSFVFCHSDINGKIIVPYYLLEQQTTATGTGISIVTYNSGHYTSPVSSVLDQVNISEVVTSSDSVSFHANGSLKTILAEAYTLHLTVGGPTRVLINDVEVFNNSSITTEQTLNIPLDLKPSHEYDVEIYSAATTANGVLKLEWSSDNTAQTLVPSTSLYGTQTLTSSIRLFVTDVTSGAQDETVIRAKAGSTLKFDGTYDARKLTNQSTMTPQLYTNINGESYSINSIPTIDHTIAIPIEVIPKRDGQFRISLGEYLTGDLPILLLDNNGTLLADLRSENYTVTLDSGIVAHYNLAFNQADATHLYVNNETITVSSNSTTDLLVLKDQGQVNITAGSRYNVTTLINNAGSANLRLLSSASGTGMLMNHTPGVRATVEQFIAKDTWHYMGSPMVEKIKASQVFWSLYVARMDEVLATDGTESGWTYLTENDSITPGVGYAIKNDVSADITRAFAGTLNTGSVAPTITKSGEGWNLICNPYPVSIDWNSISKTNLNTTVYVYNNGTYGTYNTSLGDGVSGTNNVTQYIAPMQAFFVKASAASPVFTLSDDTKIAQIAPFKSSPASSVVRLTITDGEGRKDETLIIANPVASTLFDDDMDSYKLIVDGSMVPQIYTETDAEYSINTIPLFDQLAVIPLRILAKEDGEHILSLNLQNVDTKMPVLLLDNQKNILENLTANNYALNLKANNTDDFYIAFSYTATKTDVIPNVNIVLQVKHHTITINGLDENSRIEIFNMAGQKVASELSSNGNLNIEINQEGIFIVKAYSPNGFTYNRKVIIK